MFLLTLTLTSMISVEVPNPLLRALEQGDSHLARSLLRGPDAEELLKQRSSDSKRKEQKRKDMKR